MLLLLHLLPQCLFNLFTLFIYQFYILYILFRFFQWFHDFHVCKMFVPRPGIHIASCPWPDQRICTCTYHNCKWCNWFYILKCFNVFLNFVHSHISHDLSYVFIYIFGFLGQSNFHNFPWWNTNISYDIHIHIYMYVFYIYIYIHIYLYTYIIFTYVYNV